MISFSLHCAKDHEFEAWFGSSDDFDRQKDEGLLSCPMCGNEEVKKSLMAPNVSTSKSDDVPIQQAETKNDDGKSTHLAGINEAQKKLLPAMRELRSKLLESAEDVGNKFGEEARKIHYGEADARSIYGKTDAEDAAKLVEEGIEFVPLPELPDDKN